ncbi:MAG: hypothetical protein MUD17_12835, partial [Gemmatimonadaceae bacterium]|nr:hypothetical protein [Gemmatimonadaceae bacterium]
MGGLVTLARCRDVLRVVAALALAATALRAQSATPALQSHPAYDGAVRLDPTTRTLEARWRVTVPGVVTEQIVVLLNDSLQDVQITGADVRRVTRGTQRGLARFEVGLTPAEGARPITLEIRTRGTLEISDEGINTVRADYVELGLDSFWFPVLDGFPDITGTVRLVLPTPLQIVANGDVSTRGDTAVIRTTVPLPDLAFVAAPQLTATPARGASAGGVQVRTHHTTASPALVDAIRAVAVQCAEYLNVRYGRARPLPPVELVLPSRLGPGYARKHYIVVPIGEWRGPYDSARTRAISQTGFLCHELAHFWASGADAAGADNWVNEGFAEFVAGRAVRRLVGADAWTNTVAQWRARATRAGAVWIPGRTSRPDANAAYGSVPWLLAQLETRVGESAIDQLLTRFMTEPWRTSEAVLTLFGEVLA